MAGANYVLKGDYFNYTVKSAYNGIKLTAFTGEGTALINKDTVDSYEVITEDKRESGTSAILRGAAGAALLGPVGTLAGLTAKSKGTYLVAVFFKDGKKSLLQINDKLYKELVTAMF